MEPRPKSRGKVDQRHPLFFWCGHVFAVALVLIFALVYGVSAYQLDWWKSYFFRGTLPLENRCAATAVGNDDPSAPASFAETELQPIRVPHADSLLTDKAPGDAKYLHALVRCRVTGADREAFRGDSGKLAYLHLGWVFAQDTQVLVNGSERASFKGPDKPIIPLTQKDLTAEPLIIDIIASSMRQARFGLVGAQPMTIAFGSAINARILGLETALQNVRTIYDLLPLLTFALILAFGWFFGVRARLMVAAFFFFLCGAMRPLVLYFADVWPWDISTTYFVASPFRMATGVSFIIFGMELLAIWPKAIYRTMVATVASLAVTVSTIALVQDAHALYKPFTYVYTSAAILAAGLFAAVGWRRVRVMPVGAKRRVNTAFLCICAVFMVLNGVELAQSLMGVPKTIPAHHINVLLPLFLGGVLLFTMALMEQSLRQEREAREALTERLALGRAVQDLLLPKEMQSQFGPFEYQFFYSPAEQMSGDWLFLWHAAGGELRLVMGDVVGKGPQAALAVSALLATLGDCRNVGLSMADAIERTNRNLIDMFSGHVTSTLSAICLHADGRVELFSCGAPSWTQVSDEGVRTHQLRSSLLGSDENVATGHKAIAADGGGLFLAFTDGVCDGARGKRGLQARLEKTIGAHATMALASYYDLANESGKDHVLSDDKSMIVVRKARQASKATA